MMAALADGRARRRSIASVGAPADCGAGVGASVNRRYAPPGGVGAAAGGPPDDWRELVERARASGGFDAPAIYPWSEAREEAVRSALNDADDGSAASLPEYTLEEVAQVWMDAVMPIDRGDAAAMCVPALAMAGGCSFKAPGCNDGTPKFHPTVECGTGKGIWQINYAYEPDAKAQAQAVYNIYTSNNPDYGCLSDWCAKTDCNEPLDGIGSSG